ncbi:MAG: hypothetical protein H7A23_14640 [Leptospiraceae bacterium]|nr:hypothetical protein [Leptospiraceae bacterium]MCP5495790.1 hypothetical protein [Leptospiraceae bacterium]
MIKKQFQNSLKLLFVSSLAFFFSFGTISADSACKGLEESACKGDSKCTWVQGHKRKDGAAVKGHCRSKATKGDKKEEAKSKKEEAKEKKDKKGKKDKKEKKSKKGKKDKE